MAPPSQLLLYRFGPTASFEGAVLGALERTESGGTLRVAAAFFLRRTPAGDELEAIALRGRGQGGFVTPLLDFRLDPAARRNATRRTMGDGGPGPTLRELGATLEPGEALVGVLVEHLWAEALEDAVERTGGSLVASAPVDAEAIARAFGIRRGASPSPPRTPHP